MTASPLPPIELLRSLFHYNPLTGGFTHLQTRGPRRAGQPAGSTQQGIPHLFAQGRQHKAAAVAWALSFGVDPSPQHVICVDRNPLNLALSNLALSEEPIRYTSRHGRPAKRKGWYKTDIRWNKSLGAFTARYNGEIIGEFTTRAEAIEARRIAAAQDVDEDEDCDA